MPFTAPQWMQAGRLRGRAGLMVLFLAALAMLGVGIGEHTSITGKDEYYLSLRTAMCMAEQDVWWVPCLDGEPRLKKPPMVYWLTRLSFETFGVSLFSARLVAVSLAALLVLGIALIARELGGSQQRSLLAGAISLSFMSLFLGGRMLELDVPVAAFSTLAFYALLRWYKRDEWFALVLAGGLLAAGFLTKGPVVLIVCGAGGLALLAADPEARRRIARQPLAVPGMLLFAALLALPWFLHVRQLYPELSGAALSTELEARRFFQVSPVPLYGFLMLTLPWSFVVIFRAVDRGGLDDVERRRWLFLILWLLLTLLPFFMIRSFERYLYGSLVPAALLLALLPMTATRTWRWCARAGLFLVAALALPLIALSLWLTGPEPLPLLGLILPVWMAYHWWRARKPEFMAFSAALTWVYLLGIVYPRLGINQVPPHVTELARERPVVFYHGPQPGLLPAVLGRSLSHVDERWRLPQELSRNCTAFLVFAEEHEGAAAIDGLRERGYRTRELERFGVLSARVRWQDMLRQDAGADELRRAIAARDLTPVKPRVLMIEAIKAPPCPSE